MTWITIVWSMNAAACLTLAGIYLLVWCKQREGWAHLLFTFTAVAAAAIAAFELAMMHAETVGRYEALIRWTHVPVWVLVVSLVGFVRLYLRAGRPWLAWTVCGGRTLALMLNFLTGVNMNYREITAVRRIPFRGEPVSIAVGVPNPWMLVGQLS